MYDNIVFRTFVKITYCDKAFLIKDYHHHHHQERGFFLVLFNHVISTEGPLSLKHTSFT